MAENLISTLGNSSIPQNEKCAKLYAFIQSVFQEETPPTQISKFLSCFPHEIQNSPLYQQVKFKLACALKNSQLILELLLHGDPEIQSKAIKLSWLYKATSTCSEKGEEFQNYQLLIQALPSMSHSVREGVLRSMGKWVSHSQWQTKSVSNGNGLDEIFEQIQISHGLQSAMPLLPCCTQEKIEGVLLSQSKVSDRQLVSIAHRFENLVYKALTRYCELNNKFPGNSNISKTFSSLYDQNPEKCLEFFIAHLRYLPPNWEEAGPVLKLGRRVKRILIQKRRDLIINNFELFSTKFKITWRGRCLIWRALSREEYLKFLTSALPAQIAEVVTDGRIWPWLSPKFMRRGTQLEILAELFKMKYGIQNWRHPDCLQFLSPEIVALLPSGDKLAIASWKLENKKGMKHFHEFYALNSYFEYSNFAAWLALKPLPLAVQELQNLFMSEQTFYKKGQYLKYLLITCYLNGDSFNGDFSQALNFIGGNLKSDQEEARAGILDTVADLFLNRPPLADFKIRKEHWDSVVEFLKVAIFFNKDTGEGAVEAKKQLVEGYLNFLIKNSINDFKTVVQLYLKLRALIDAPQYRGWVIPSGRNIPAKTVEEIRDLCLGQLEEFYPLPSSGPLPPNVVGILRSILRSRNRNGVNLNFKEEGSWLRERLHEILQLEDGAGTTYRKRPRLKGYRGRPFEKPQVISRQEILGGFVRNSNFREGTALENYLNEFCCQPLLTHFLEIEPKPPLLFENWDRILEQNLASQFKSEMNSSFLHFMAQIQNWHSDFGLVEKSRQFCLKLVQDAATGALQLKTNATRLLSILAKSSGEAHLNFVAIAAKYSTRDPGTGSKIGAGDKEIIKELDQAKVEALEMSKAVVESLSNLNTRGNLTAFFETILKFSQQENLTQLSLVALYRHILHGDPSEAKNLLQNFLTQTQTHWLGQGHVTTAKHLIRLYFLISKSQEALMMASQLWTLYNDPKFSHQGPGQLTLRFELLAQVLTLLVEGQSSSSLACWTLLESIIRDLKSEDKLCLRHLCHASLFSKFPPSLLSPYIKCVLLHLKGLKGAGASTDTELQGFVNEIESHVTSTALDEEILSWVIRQDFCQFKTQCYCIPNYCVHTTHFYLSYLFGALNLNFKFSSQILAGRLSSVKIVLARFIEEDWDETKKEDWDPEIFYVTRRSLDCFIIGVCKKGVEFLHGGEEREFQNGNGGEREIRFKLVRLIYEEFLKLFKATPLKCFKEIWHLELALLLVDAMERGGKGRENLNLFGQFAVKLIEQTVAQYGSEIVHVILQIFKQFLDSTLPPEWRSVDHVVRILDGFLESNSRHNSIQIILIQLLPRSKPQGSEMVKKYEEIQDKIKLRGEDILRICQWLP